MTRSHGRKRLTARRVRQIVTEVLDMRVCVSKRLPRQPADGFTT